MARSISELISELRDSFLSRDFDRVEEALVAREARLKAELEDRKREIGSLKEKISFERLERINAELELQRSRQKDCGAEKVKSDNGFGLHGEASVKSRTCKVEIGGEGEGKKVGALGQKKTEGGVFENVKEMKIREERKKEGVETNGSVSKKRYQSHTAAPGGKLEAKGIIVIDESDEDEYNFQVMPDKKKTTSCTSIDNDYRTSTSGALQQKNLLKGLTESIGNLKRKIVSSRNVLDELDTDVSSSTSSSSSSSSGSSGPLDIIDRLPTSNKKLKADATSLELNLNFLQRKKS